jgi:hypothetical protein
MMIVGPVGVADALASCIMMRRTTVSADSRALETLEAEARRRGVSLSALLAEAVDDKADAIRASRRPRLGIGRSHDGLSAAEVTALPVAEPPA